MSGWQLSAQRRRSGQSRPRSPFHPTRPIPGAAVGVGFGARRGVPPDDAEQPLSLSLPTFAGMRGNEQDAPIPDLPALASERGSSTRSRPLPPPEDRSAQAGKRSFKRALKFLSPPPSTAGVAVPSIDQNRPAWLGTRTRRVRRPGGAGRRRRRPSPSSPVDRGIAA